ncbi:MAG: hypothetical protein IT303_10245 [Dehalococcoidia bacterium]|nr:hypothetical protein [Dehalococcoidia bacterium]
MNRIPHFLRLGLLPSLALAALFAAACGNGEDDEGTASATGTVQGTGFEVIDLAANIPADQRNVINAVPAGLELTTGRNNFVFGITNKDDEPQGDARDITVTFYDVRDPAKPKPVLTTTQVFESAPGVGPVTQHEHPNGETHTHGGEDDDRVGYYVPVTFEHPGTWGVAVRATLKDGKSTGVSSFGFVVYEKPRIPAPGQPALKSDNLTKADVSNLAEIDSGTPPNDMHDVKIKDAVAKGRPMVIVFATPAYCTSRFCGPVTEEMETLQAKYRDKVDFVHVEIWRNFDSQTLNPTAREWLIRKDDGGLSEPFVYVVGKDGVIYDRWEGPVSASVVEAAVQAVADGKTFQ